jgi:hypothetical protein
MKRIKRFFKRGKKKDKDLGGHAGAAEDESGEELGDDAVSQAAASSNGQDHLASGALPATSGVSHGSEAAPSARLSSAVHTDASLNKLASGMDALTAKSTAAEKDLEEAKNAVPAANSEPLEQFGQDLVSKALAKFNRESSVQDDEQLDAPLPPPSLGSTASTSGAALVSPFGTAPANASAASLLLNALGPKTPGNSSPNSRTASPPARGSSPGPKGGVANIARSDSVGSMGRSSPSRRRIEPLPAVAHTRDGPTPPMVAFADGENTASGSPVGWMSTLPKAHSALANPPVSAATIAPTELELLEPAQPSLGLARKGGVTKPAPVEARLPSPPLPPSPAPVRAHASATAATITHLPLQVIHREPDSPLAPSTPSAPASPASALRRTEPPTATLTSTTTAATTPSAATATTAVVAVHVSERSPSPPLPGSPVLAARKLSAQLKESHRVSPAASKDANLKASHEELSSLSRTASPAAPVETTKANKSAPSSPRTLRAPPSPKAARAPSPIASLASATAAAGLALIIPTAAESLSAPGSPIAARRSPKTAARNEAASPPPSPLALMASAVTATIAATALPAASPIAAAVASTSAPPSPVPIRVPHMIVAPEPAQSARSDSPASSAAFSAASAPARLVTQPGQAPPALKPATHNPPHDSQLDLAQDQGTVQLRKQQAASGRAALVASIRQSVMESQDGDLIAVLAGQLGTLPPARDDGFTLLHAACESDNGAAVAPLIAAGADPRALFEGWTPLHTAAAAGASTCVAELLRCCPDLRKHIDECEDEPNGRTPLMLAAVGGYPSTVGILLRAGANPSRQDNAGCSATLLAVENEQFEVRVAGFCLCC